MPNAYSSDERERVIARVESGASRREAPEDVETRCAAGIRHAASTFREALWARYFTAALSDCRNMQLHSSRLFVRC